MYIWHVQMLIDDGVLRAVRDQIIILPLYLQARRTKSDIEAHTKTIQAARGRKKKNMSKQQQ